MARALSSRRPTSARTGAAAKEIRSLWTWFEKRMRKEGNPTSFDRAAKAITAAIPQTERHTLDGQGHVVAPELMARVLKTFFNQ